MQRVSKAGRVAIVLALASTMAGCGWINTLKAKKAFKEANAAYASQDYKKAAEHYLEALAAKPDLTQAYFYLGNSYDNMYKVSKQGQPENDKYIELAIEYYNKAYQQEQDPKMKKLALDFLADVYGPTKLNDPERAEPILEQIITVDPKDTTGYILLSNLKTEMGDYEAAEAALNKARDVNPNDPAIYARLADFYNKQGDFEKTVAALRERAAKEPENPEAFYTIATYFWDKAYRDFRITDAQKSQFAAEGLTAVDQALKLNPSYLEAVTYRGLLLRVQAGLEKDAAKQKALMTDAEAMQARALELRKAKAAGATE
ncbi:MAG: tetratricopeptide repeat protein [Acidobacteria bacterium]|jgi:tetratricopeptide (TPR) repeat protein|nr:tetratricopeptide repeat protein [Acidobacteriota bacterium]